MSNVPIPSSEERARSASIRSMTLATLQAALAAQLPRGWRSELIERESRKHDSQVVVTAPSGAKSVFSVEVQRHFEPRDVRRFEPRSTPEERPLLVVAPYISPRSRELLRERNVCYLDLNGNVWIATSSMLIDRTGSDLRPASDGTTRRRTSLRGPKTARVVRFVCDFRAPLTVRRISLETGVDAGNVSRTLELLEREHLVERESGSVASTDWLALITRWSRDAANDRVDDSFLEARGLEIFQKRLRVWDKPYSLTGAYAGAYIAPAAAPVACDVYVRDIEEARLELQLRRSDRIGNVRIIEAPDPVVFERTMTIDGDVVACPSQIAADLLSLPKRSSDEVGALIDWMQRNEDDWRR